MPANRGQAQRRVVLIVVASIGALLGVTYVSERILNTRELGPEEQARNCKNQQYTCTGYPLAGSPFKPDGGRPPYASLIVVGSKCTNDAGVPYRALPQLDNEVLLDPNLCVETGDAGTAIAPQALPIGEDVNGCACKRDRFCSLILPDGGTTTAPWGETLPYQGFTGADCFRKVCGEFAGISSWPAECPTEKPAGELE